jgi:hypothetical protein
VTEWKKLAQLPGPYAHSPQLGLSVLSRHVLIMSLKDVFVMGCDLALGTTCDGEKGALNVAERERVIPWVFDQSLEKLVQGGIGSRHVAILSLCEAAKKNRVRNETFGGMPRAKPDGTGPHSPE